MCLEWNLEGQWEARGYQLIKTFYILTAEIIKYMKYTSTILCIAFMLAACQLLNAQDTGANASESTQNQNTVDFKRNLLKVNLPGLVVKNYSLQYERVMGKATSLALSLRTMPTSSIPLKGFILDLADNDPDTKDVLDKLRLSNFAITPEFRWYVGKRGYGRGFYIAPFYRYARFKSNDVVVEYDNTESITLKGEQSAHTGGLLFGAQWFLGKTICLDWWILGPHYGSGDGLFTGVTDHLLSPQEQSSLRDALEDIDIPLVKEQITVTANGANVKFTGPWAGLRAGLSLGIRF